MPESEGCIIEWSRVKCIFDSSCTVWRKVPNLYSGSSPDCALLLLSISNSSCHAVGSVGFQYMPCRWRFNIYFVGLISGRRFASYYPPMTTIRHVPLSKERCQRYGDALRARYVKCICNPIFRIGKRPFSTVLLGSWRHTTDGENRGG